MHDLRPLAEKAAALLIAREEHIVVAESSAGGLISATLLAIPGASKYYIGGGVLYTGRALKTLLAISREDFTSRGMRSSSEPYAQFLAETIRERHRVTWALSETGAAGPTGNPYGDPAGHTCYAIAGPITEARTLRTESEDRWQNMWAFSEAALNLLVESLERAPPPKR